MREFTKKHITYLIIGIIALLGTVAYGTYALFFRSAIQNSTNQLGAISCVELSFTSKNDSINLEHAYPMSDNEALMSEPYSFQLENNFFIVFINQIFTNRRFLNINQFFLIGYFRIEETDTHGIIV